MVRKRIVSLELGRIICIIADDCMDDSLFVPWNIIDDGDVPTSVSLFEQTSRLPIHLVRSEISANNLQKYKFFLATKDLLRSL